MILFPCNADTYNDAILSMVVQKYPFVLVDRRLPGWKQIMWGLITDWGLKLPLNIFSV